MIYLKNIVLNGLKRIFRNQKKDFLEKALPTTRAILGRQFAD